MKKNNIKGFTLLELLIVIAIIAILATILIIVINPVETLKRARDVQRLSDLSTLKTAMSLYMINSSDFNSMGLDGKGGASCKNISDNSWTTEGAVYYSYQLATSTGTDTVNLGLDAKYSNDPRGVTGNGWIPVDLGSLAGSSPISNLPVDPLNSMNTASVTINDYVYRYACGINPTSFEINARLESMTYTSDDNMHLNDGGDNDGLYEIGTNLRILGNRTDF